MKDTLGIIINNPCKELAALTEHRNPLTLPFFARYRLIDFTLSNMVNSNMHKIAVIASDKYRSLLDHVGTGQEWGLSRKTHSLIILQGARKLSNSSARDISLLDFENNDVIFNRNRKSNYLIASPNIVCRIDYNEVVNEHKKSMADVTLVGTKIEEHDEGSNCIYISCDEEGKVYEITIDKTENTTHKYSGKLVVRRETLMQLMDTAHDVGEYEMLTLLMENIASFSIKCYQYNGYLRRITSIKSYFETNLELLDTDISCKLFSGSNIIYTKTKDNHPTLYKDSSSVKNACIASGSLIEGEVRNSVLFRHVKVEKNAKISNSVIMSGCQIGEGTELDYVVADRHVVIGNNVVLKGTKESPVVLKKETVI